MADGQGIEPSTDGFQKATANEAPFRQIVVPLPVCEWSAVSDPRLRTQDDRVLHDRATGLSVVRRNSQEARAGVEEGEEVPRARPDTRDVDPDLRITLLGAFRVGVGPRLVQDREWRLRKTKNLVKLLALAPSHRLHREHLIDVLWPEQDPGLASNNLNKAVHMARRVLEPGLPPATRSRYLHLEDDSLVLRPPGELWVDVEQFERTALRARNSGSPEAYAEALQCYSGDLLPEDRYEDWAVGRREELQSLYLRLLLDLARSQERRGDPAAAAELLREVVARDPAHEEAQVALMRVHVQTGHRHQALRQFRQLREALRRELDVEPDPTTQQLYDQIVSGQALTGPSPRAQSADQSWSSIARESAQGRMRPGLVGRDAELEVLEDILDTLFTGQGRTLLVAGEAGIGKSRLVAEVVERVRSRGGIALMGAAYEHEGRLSFGPFIEALGTIDTGGGEGGLQAIFGDALHDFSRLPPPGASVIRTDRERFFYGITQLLQRRALDAPLLLTLDDLHAADDASLQLLHYLARMTRSDPILLFATFRPEDAPAVSQLSQLVSALQRERLAVRLDLQRFAPPEVDLLVATLLDDQPVDRVVFEAIHRVAAGNPFFTSEIVRSLQESGGLRQVDGRWLLLAEDVPISSPMRDLLVGRMERLGSEAMQVLNLASVIGRDISFPLLRAAGDLADGTVLDGLDLCLRHHVLEETDEGYRFCHPLQRTVMYERLSHARRTHLHGRVAEALEALYSGSLEDHAEVLAYHWMRSEQPEQAVPFLIPSGDRAASLHANDAAVAAYSQAIELISRRCEPDRNYSLVADLWEKVGDLHALAARAGQDEAAYNAAIEGLDRVPQAEPDRQARLHRKAGYAALVRHDVADALPHLSAAEAVLHDWPESVEWGRVRLVRALSLWEEGRYSEARHSAQESLTLARQHGEGIDLLNAYTTLALVLHSSGEWKEGLQIEIEHIGVAADTDTGLGLLFDVHMCLGEYHLYGDVSFDAVESYARHTLELARGVGARRAQALAWLLLGESLLVRGCWTEAETHLLQSLEMQRDAGSVAGQYLALQRLAELSVYRGDHAAADEYVRQALALAVDPVMATHVVGRIYAVAALNELERGEPSEAGRVLAQASDVLERTGTCATCSALLHPISAETYVAVGDLDRAERHAHAASQAARCWESGTWRAMAHMTHGTVLRARNDYDRATGVFLAAAEIFEQIGQRFDAARCVFRAAQSRADCGDTEQARSLTKGALAVFRELGAETARRQAEEHLSSLEAR